jgi:hypothetical protein
MRLENQFNRQMMEDTLYLDGHLLMGMGIMMFG